MKKWTLEKVAYIQAQRATGRRVVDIAKDFGISEAALYHILRRKFGGNGTVDPADVFSYEDVQIVTGIPARTIESLIECKKLRGNGTVERKIGRAHV
jgi:hypothetical protein